MQCQMNQDNGAITVQLVGALTVDAVEPLRQELLPCLSVTGLLTVDGAQITDCDTAGAQLLFAFIRTLRAQGQAPAGLQLAAPIHETLRRIGLSLAAHEATTEGGQHG